MTIISSGEILSVSDGGALLSSGGTSMPFNGPISGLTLLGGSEYVYSGGVDSGTTISAGGREGVYASGSALSDVVSSGGYEFVALGGVVEDTTLVPGAQQDVNGLAIGVSVGGPETTVDYADAFQIVLSGGVATGTNVTSNGGLQVEQDGIVSSAIIGAGGAFYAYGGTVSNVVVSSGATEFLASGTTLIADDIKSGADLRFRISSGSTYTPTASPTFSGVIIESGATISYDVYGVLSGGVLIGGQTDIESGGRARSTTISDGLVSVDSGGRISAATIDAGGGLLLQGGTATNVTVSSGGLIHLTPNSRITGIDVQSGAEAEVSIASGSTVTLNSNLPVALSGLTIEADANLSYEVYGKLLGGIFSGSGVSFVFSGGLISGASLGSGPEVIIVQSGGVTSNVGIYANAFEGIDPGGTDVATVLDDGSEYSQGTTSNAKVDTGGNLYLEAGAIASGVTIFGGGTVTVWSGGTANNLTVLSGGYEEIEAGGSAFADLIASGGAETNYGVGTGTTVESGGAETLSGGTLVSGVVKSGGIINGLTISGGTSFTDPIGKFSLDGVKIKSGADVGFDVLGTLSGGILQDSNAEYNSAYGYAPTSVTDTIEAGGAIVGTQVGIGGELDVDAGAVASAVSVANDGFAYLDGGTTTGDVIGTGGDELVDSGISLNETVSGAGAYLNVDGYAGSTIVSGTVVSAGGIEYVAVGSALGAVIDAGGSLFATYFGPQAGTIPMVGAVTVNSGGIVDTDATTLSAGVFVGGVVESGGVFNGLAVAVGRTLTPGSGSAFTSDTIQFDAGASVGFDVLGTISGSAVSAGVFDTIESGGTARGVVVSSGGGLYISSGGVLSDVVIRSGGFVQGLVVSSGTTFVVPTSGTLSIDGAKIKQGADVGFNIYGTISGGAVGYGSDGNYVQDRVESGGLLSGASVLSFGVVNIRPGGVASNTVVNSSGTSYVEGGEDVAPTIAGFELINVGTVESATITDGGMLDIDYSVDYVQGYSGGSAAASGTIIESGGFMFIYDGLAKGTTIESGGSLIVSSGGTAKNITISGGTVTVEGGAVIAKTVKFAGSGSDLILQSTGIAADIKGFGTGDFLDLNSTAYVSGGESVSFAEAASQTSGTLSVSSGGITDSFTLLGAYTSGAFSLSNDGTGGTLVTLGAAPASPPQVGVANQLIQAMAALDGSGGAALTEALATHSAASPFVAGPVGR